MAMEDRETAAASTRMAWPSADLVGAPDPASRAGSLKAATYHPSNLSFSAVRRRAETLGSNIWIPI